MKNKKRFKIFGYELKDNVPSYISFIILAISLIFATGLSALTVNCSVESGVAITSAADFNSQTVQTSATKNVIIAIIDGIRYQESFGDSTHQYIPRIWNELRPQGTIYTNLWNVGITATTGGHQTIITGVTQLLSNNGKIKADQRTKQPNIFEYYRKQKNVPMEEVWSVVAKTDNLHALDYSLNPDYGYDWRSSIRCTDHAPDPNTYEIVKQVMDENQPSLMLINFASVDETGHFGGYQKYTNAIKTADQIVYDLWNKIQSDPYYKDTTTLIITTDHGRHSGGYFTGFKGHGASTREDRHLIFLALGPDIQQNYVVDGFHQQIDITPTIGALLNFKTPYADGEVLSEMLIDSNIALNNQIVKNIKPKLAVNSSGLHLIYHKKDTTNGGFDIYYQKSTDEAISWSQPILIFDSIESRRFYEADISVDSQGNMILTLATALVPVDLGGPSFEWQAFNRASSDGGSSWGNIRARRKLGVIASPPSLVSKGNKEFAAVAIGTSSKYGINKLFYFKRDSGGWSSTAINDEKKVNLLNPSLATNGTMVRVVWQNIGDEDPYKFWNLIDDVSINGSLTWGVDRKITQNTQAIVFQYDPEISCFNGSQICQLVWSTLESSTTTADFWQIQQLTSTDGGYSWINNKILSATSIDAWQPALTQLSDSQSVVVWQQHQSGQVDIYGLEKDGSNWGPILALTPTDGIDSVLSDITSYNGNVYLAWQELVNNTWTIKTKKIEF